MFAGYGGASFALKKAGIPFECVGYSEIDKYAIQCYEQNHKCAKNYGDCRIIKPEELPSFDLLTGGFPCQPFSMAGNRKGELDPRGTLFYDIIRIAEAKQPKWMLLENVKGITFKNHRKTFEKILSELDRIGYNVYWKVLNSKDYGIPQNRERVFFVCFRKDIDKHNFRFPEKQELKLFLKDILEDEVDERYYLKPEKVKKLLSEFKMPDVSYTIDANYHKGINLKGYLTKKRRQLVMPVLTPDRIPKRQKGRRFKNPDEPSFTVNTQDRHGILQINEQPRLITVDKNGNEIPNMPGIGQGKRIYSGKGITPSLNVKWTPKIITVGNYSPSKHNASRIVSINGISPTVKENHGTVTGVFMNDLSIRKLTPRECFRLMGFLNDEINLEGLSNTQKYKLAGNGWDINLVARIFKNMIGPPFVLKGGERIKIRPIKK